MAFRLLHTSDWHLGQHFYGKSRLNEHRQFLDWLLEQIATQQIDAVVVAGDIFDTGTPPSYARELYFDFVVKMHALDCPLVVLAGNHDSVAMISESKTVLSKLGCHVIAKAQSFDEDPHQIVKLENKAGDSCIICAIPFIRPRDIVASTAGQSATDKQQALQQAIADHYQQLIEQAKAEESGASAIVATGHLTTVGASTSESVRDIYIGTLDAFPASAFPEVDYIALGHIHKSQKVAKSEHIRYCGSPIALSFDEDASKKSVNIASFEQGILTEVEQLAVPVFQPMASVSVALEQIKDKVTALVSDAKLTEDQTLWLDIAIDTSDYLTDLSARVQEALTDLPAEVLLVRRAKTQSKTLQSEDKITLDELNTHDVFAARLAQETWEDEGQAERKERLVTLFNQVVEQCQQDNSEQNS